MTPCSYCGGHGADPWSDNVNWLPCPKCRGSGQARAMSHQPRDNEIVVDDHLTQEIEHEANQEAKRRD